MQQDAYTPQPTQPPQSYQPHQPQQYPSPKKGLAITSMILGIAGLVLALIPFVGLVLGLPAVILAIIVFVKKLGGKGMAIAGIITGAIAILIGIIMMLITMVTYQRIQERAQVSTNRTTALEVRSKAVTYHATAGVYPTYQELITQTEFPLAKVDAELADKLTDGASAEANVNKPVAYRGCEHGAEITYWDSATQSSKLDREIGDPSLCEF